MEVQRPVVAVDIDEVLCRFVAALNAHANKENGTVFSESDFHSYSTSTTTILHLVIISYVSLCLYTNVTCARDFSGGIHCCYVTLVGNFAPGCAVYTFSRFPHSYYSRVHVAFRDVWNCEEEESARRVQSYLASSDFANGLEVGCCILLGIVTSRLSSLECMHLAT